MTAPRGIRYYGGGDLGGYGHAAIAYVRALVNAGVPVQWIPVDWTAHDMRSGSWVRPDGGPRFMLSMLGEHSHLVDVPALIERTSRAVAYDTIIVHAPPESWPALFEPGKRNIGNTVWETDRSPSHWLPLMRRADRVIVPCEFNREVFRRGGLERPIAVVPHIRRHAWADFSPSELTAARADLGIPADHRVLYTLNTWSPRKALPELIHACATAFSGDDAVTLLIKTGPEGYEQGPLYGLRPTRELAQRAITAAAERLRRPAPHIVLHDETLDGDGLDLIHAIGDIYVSLSRGEGWGLGAFEAATLGKPVVMTGWGGHTEYLGQGWPGAVPYRMVPVALWPPHAPTYFPSQRWAEPDLGAAAAMLHAAVADPAPAREAAARIRERIFADYAEPVLVRRLLEAIGD